jgi:hypothetical protein
MKHLLIENKGELPEAALLLMGASTKRNDSDKIGMFGTGAKYAVSALLREGVEFEVHTTETELTAGDLIPGGSGLVSAITKTTPRRYRFRSDPVPLKDQIFNQVVLLRDSERKGTPLSFTTEMGGLGWTVNDALRELVSNAYDEDEPDVGVVEEAPVARPGYTRVYVRLTPKVKEFWQEFGGWFTQKRTPVYSGEGWRLYKPFGPGVRVFRKGALAYSDPDMKAVFDYDLDYLTVNEERKASRWDCTWQVASILRLLPAGALRTILKSATAKDTFESSVDPTYHQQPGWKELLGDTILVELGQAALFEAELSHFDTMILPNKWVVAMKESGCRTLEDVISATRMRGYKVLTPEELGPAENSRLQAGIGFLDAAGRRIELDRVRVIECDEGGVRGEWLPKEKLICIHRKVLQENVPAVVKVLFHEEIHEKTGASDYSREYVDGIIDAWLELAQEKLERWL